MESEEDLLNLLTTLDYIEKARRNLAERNKKITLHLSKINDHHYDSIDRLGWIIHDYDSRISQLVKGANARARIQIIEAQKEPYLRQQRLLKDGWNVIASTLREESRKLFAFPRELRERIYEYLYVKSTEDQPLTFSWPDIDVRGSMLPRDPYLYLNAHIVDPQIAAEAAQILFNINVFHISTYSSVTLTKFLRTDHYASGITPRDVMRRVHLSQSIEPCTYHLSHMEFEDNERSLPGNNIRFDNYRVNITALLEMKDLRVVDLHLLWNHTHLSAVEFRSFSPAIKTLKERGVVVKVKGAITNDYDYLCPGNANTIPPRDLSELFNEPSAEDWAETRELGTLHFDHLEDEYDHNLDQYYGTLQIPTMSGAGTMAQWKTYLHEHYQVFKERNTEESIEEKIQDLDSAERSS